LPLGVDQGDAFFQAIAAIAGHLFQVRQNRKLLRPGFAGDLVAPPTAYPAQALRFHYH
jgi:hypothetical protein